MAAWAPRPKRRGGWARHLLSFGLIVLLLVALGVAGEWVWALIEAPWSIGAAGPTLTGTWEGPLRAKLGGRYHLVVELRYEPPPQFGSGRARSGQTGRARGAELRGTARLCTAAGAVHDYDVLGRADRSGEHVEIQLGAPRGVAYAPWFYLRGSWHGATLAVTPTRNPFDPDGVYRPDRTVSSNDPDDPLAPTELRKGSMADFEAACRQLGRAGA